MGDVGEFWRDVGPSMKEDSQQRRARNREWSAAFLEENGIRFESKNLDAHLIVTHAGRTADFWPGTGLYAIREGGRFGTVPQGIRRKGRGVRNLLRQLRALEAKPMAQPAIPPPAETKMGDVVSAALVSVLDRPGDQPAALLVMDKEGNLLIVFQYSDPDRKPNALVFNPLQSRVRPRRVGDPYWYRFQNRAGELVVEGRVGDGYDVAFSMRTLQPDIPVESPPFQIRMPAA